MKRSRIQLRWFEAGVALAVVAGFAAIGPFRGTLAPIPWVMVLSTLVLFLTPGVLLVRWFLSDYFFGAAIAPAAFVTSVGLFALLAVPMLILQSTLEAYLWACGMFVGVCWLASLVLIFRPEQAEEGQTGVVLSDRGGLLWVPFAALVAALSYIARNTAPSYYGDIWIYLSWVREYLSGDRLASVEPFFGSEVGLSRARINGWLLEQAAVSRVSGVDPVDLVFSYLNPALVVVAFLVFYALARILFESEKAALLSGCLYALFFFVHLSQSRIAWGRRVRPAPARGQTCRQVPLLAAGAGFRLRVSARWGEAVFPWFLVPLLCRHGRASHRFGDHRDLHGRFRHFAPCRQPSQPRGVGQDLGHGSYWCRDHRRSCGPGLVVYR